MSNTRTLSASSFVLMMLFSSAAFAGQRTAADAGALAAAVARHADSQITDRAAIHEAIARPEVRDVAARFGVDLDRVAATVDTMSGADLANAAATAREVNGELVGGATTVVISTTTIIIALLVIILLVVALR